MLQYLIDLLSVAYLTDLFASLTDLLTVWDSLTDLLTLLPLLLTYSLCSLSYWLTHSLWPIWLTYSLCCLSVWLTNYMASWLTYSLCCLSYWLTHSLWPLLLTYSLSCLSDGSVLLLYCHLIAHALGLARLDLCKHIMSGQSTAKNNNANISCYCTVGRSMHWNCNCKK